MFFLRSCEIIYSDYTRRSVNECDGFFAMFDMSNVSLLEVLLVLVSFLISVYFILKIIFLLKNNGE